HQRYADDSFLAVERGRTGSQFLPKPDISDITNPDGNTFAPAHNNLLDIFNAGHLTWNSNQILFTVPLDVTGADVRIVAHQRVHHIAKTQSITNETLWSRRDVVLLFVATDRIDFDYARDIAQLRFDDPFLNGAQIRAGVGLSLFVLRVLLRFD